MEVTDQTLFPQDRCNPDRFSIEQRSFLLTHLGETPSIAGIKMNDRTGEYEHPDLHRPVDIVVCRVALQRFWEDTSKHGQEDANLVRKLRIKKHFMASLEGHKRTTEIREAHGGAIDYSLIGVGRGKGETSVLSAFAFDLTSKNAPPRENWFGTLVEDLENDESLDLEAIESKLDEALAEDVQELIANEEAQAAEVVEEDEIKVVPVSLGCPYCEWETKPNDKIPSRSLKMHVRRGHTDRFEEFRLTSLIVEGRVEPEVAATE